MHALQAWFWRLIVLLGYCVYLVEIVKSGIHPGPKDSKNMVDRVIRVAGGLFILIIFLIAFFVFNPPPK